MFFLKAKLIMTKPITKITIVGGGTAGWLTALYLTTFLNHKADSTKPQCNITLIESSEIPTVGVGEATIQSIRETFQSLDLDETEWMTRCNATFKIAIKFVNWLGKNDVFWHPFNGLPTINGLDLSHYLVEKKLNHNPDFDLQSSLVEVPICLAQKSPKLGTEKDYQGQVDYGYHLDAGLLASYLKEKAILRGVNHILDQVQDVKLTEQGFIKSLKTENHGDIEGELFIDCSGFKGLLMNQTLAEPFTPYSDSLFCDRAIAIALPTEDDKDGINPYTTATALSSGWSWHTPLYGRSGNGYVYSSQFLESEQAEKEFRNFLGEKASNAPARHLKMRIGKNSNTWVKNCVSIGLSSGFIEPLESTGIYLIEMGIKTLMSYFPDLTFNPVFRNQYNRRMTQFYEEIRDFIILHYYLVQREDTSFWKANKNDAIIPESLQEKLDYFQVMSPNLDGFEPHLLFEDYSYFCILGGKQYLPKNSLPILNYLDVKEADIALENIVTKAQKMQSILPNHYEYLKELHQGKLENFRVLFGKNFRQPSILTTR